MLLYQSHRMKVDRINMLAQRDYEAGQALTFRYCALCNNGDEEYADLYSAEYRRLMKESPINAKICN
jgi:hypothetical protein